MNVKNDQKMHHNMTADQTSYSSLMPKFSTLFTAKDVDFMIFKVFQTEYISN